MRLIASLLGLALVSPDALADVHIQFKRLSEKVIEVSYSPTTACSELTFDKPGKNDPHLREGWQSSTPCATLDGDTIHFNGDACRKATFKVPVSSAMIHGYYPAFPIAGGVWIHTSNYVTDQRCGAAHYTFLAPAVAAEGKIQRQRATLKWDNRDHTAALLLPALPPPSKGVPIWIDPALPQETRTLIREVANGTVDYLRARLPDAPFHMPILSAAGIQNGGTTRVDGNGGDVLRLALYNWPASPDKDARNQTTHLVAHEFSHEFQTFPDAKKYPDERLIHEGGAEFMQWMVHIKHGWLSKETAAQYLNDALGDCMLATGNLPWASVSAQTKSSERLAYRCGLPAYVLAMAASSDADTPFQRLNAFYKRMQSSELPDFAQVVECGGNAACQPKWLPLLLGDQMVMREVWAQLATETGLLKPASAGQAQINSMIITAVGELMTEDCGHRDMYPAPDGILLDGDQRCRHLAGKHYASKIGGEPLFASDKALQALIHSCKQSLQVTVEMKDGTRMNLACSKPYQPLQSFYQVDMDRVLAILKP
ncbi:hypothetical protein KSF73_13970 [Burkholderiaceae bacterium DAT-1]|nr:hypothetical protein [Burkholderiaceae bacterium DAT-1]